MVKIVKKTRDGRCVFEKDGVYFVLTKEQAEAIVPTMNEYEANKNGNIAT